MSKEVDNALKFLVSNGEKRPRDVPKVELQEALKVLEKASQLGLNPEHIEFLAYKVVFTNSFNLQTRRRLLYCLVSEDKDFPFDLISYAVSDATVVGTNLVWQHAVLAWLSGMLEYGIIPPSHENICICYSSIFNLASHLYLCGLACKILTLLTVREDVTSCRALILMQLKLKLGFFVPVSQLLRLYHLFRPDLVAGELSDRRVMTSCPKNFREALLAARQRQQEELGASTGLQEGNQIWHESTRVERVNIYQRKTVVPHPHIHKYVTTLEEKKRKVIYVSQFRKLNEMIRGLDDYQYWQWPTNPASHMMYPLILPLFRSHHLHVLVSLTNWLEIALRTEVISNAGNPGKERRAQLLDCTLELCRVTAAPLPLPVINHFINEYISTSWDLHQDNDKVLRLLEYVAFTSPEFLSETLLKLVAQLTCKMPLMSWCRIVEAMTATAAFWCLMEYHDNTSNDLTVQPQELFHEQHGVGLWYLTRHLENTFKAAVLTYQAHPLCLHHILDYYVKVNDYAEKLELSLVYFPPVLITLSILTSTDLTATHRLGLLMKSMRGWNERLLADKRADPIEEELRLEALESMEGFNSAVRLYCSALYTGKFLSSAWEKDLDQFYPFHFLEDVRGRESVYKSLAITNALSYFPYNVNSMLDISDGAEIQFEDKRESVTAELRQAGLTGIEECIKEYKEQ